MGNNTNKASMDMLHEKVNKHMEASKELAVLPAVDKAADVLSSFISIMFFVIVVAVFMLFVNTGSSYFMVSGVYLVLALVLCFIYMFKDSFVKMSVDNLITTKLLKCKNSDFSIPDLLKKTHEEA
jgi:hypothetical protein